MKTVEINWSSMALIQGLEISEVNWFINVLSITFIFKWSADSRSRWFMTGLLHFLSLLLVIITSPFSLFFVLKRCQEYERAVVLGSTLQEVNISRQMYFLSYYLSAVRRQSEDLAWSLFFLSWKGLTL